MFPGSICSSRVCGGQKHFPRISETPQLLIPEIWFNLCYCVFVHVTSMNTLMCANEQWTLDSYHPTHMQNGHVNWYECIFKCCVFTVIQLSGMKSQSFEVLISYSNSPIIHTNHFAYNYYSWLINTLLIALHWMQIVSHYKWLRLQTGEKIRKAA